MLAFAEFLQNYFVIPALMFIFVLIVVFRFNAKYIKPAKSLSKKLLLVINALKNIDDSSDLNKHILDKSFENDMILKHAWLNYKNSFHDLYEIIDGENHLISSRA
ncbi:MAG: methyl-accepting chemotaxis protein, partial [Acinetobacter sp.]